LPDLGVILLVESARRIESVALSPSDETTAANANAFPHMGRDYAKQVGFRRPLRQLAKNGLRLECEVPRTTGLPWRTAGLISIRSVVIVRD